jgi:hypothetical protein
LLDDLALFGSASFAGAVGAKRAVASIVFAGASGAFAGSNQRGSALFSHGSSSRWFFRM